MDSLKPRHKDCGKPVDNLDHRCKCCRKPMRRVECTSLGMQQLGMFWLYCDTCPPRKENDDDKL